MKCRRGNVDDILDDRNIQISDMFKKETNINLFMNKQITLNLTGNTG